MSQEEIKIKAQGVEKFTFVHQTFVGSFSSIKPEYISSEDSTECFITPSVQIE